MKTALLIGFGKENGFTPKRLGKLKDRLQLEAIYMVCATKEDVESFLDQCDGIFDFWKINSGDYRSYAIPETPLDEEAIREMAEYDLEILYMMKRLGRHYRGFEEAKNLYLRHLSYWGSFLSYRGIDLVLMHQIPHEVYDYLIYRLCQKNKIQTCMGDMLVEYEDYPDQKRLFMKTMEYDDPRLLRKYSEFDHQHQDVSRITLDAEGEKRVRYFVELAEQYKNRKNRVSVRVKRNTELNRYYHVKASGIKSMIVSVVGRYQTWQLMKYYREKAVYPDLDRQYIYVPLHYTPECTSCPQGGGLYADQVVYIKILSQAVPEDVLIYVKEHPAQIAFGRDRSFYDRLLELDNVKLIRQDTNQMELISASLAVASLTGTTGYECQYLQKPFLMFGYYISKFAPGTVCVRTLEQCREAVNQIIGGNFPKWDVNDIRKYLSFIDSVAIRETECSDEEFANEIYQVIQGD